MLTVTVHAVAHASPASGSDRAPPYRAAHEVPSIDRRSSECRRRHFAQPDEAARAGNQRCDCVLAVVQTRELSADCVCCGHAALRTRQTGRLRPARIQRAVSSCPEKIISVIIPVCEKGQERRHETALLRFTLKAVLGGPVAQSRNLFRDPVAPCLSSLRNR